MFDKNGHSAKETAIHQKVLSEEKKEKAGSTNNWQPMKKYNTSSEQMVIYCVFCVLELNAYDFINKKNNTRKI